MDERRRYSVLDYIRSREKSDLCRFLFIAKKNIANEDILKTFNQYANDQFPGRVTGLMLVYPNFSIGLIESTENEILQVCSNFINDETILTESSIYFPMDSGIERFFDNWYGRKIDCHVCQADRDITSDWKQIYCDFSLNFYALCEELCEARAVSKAHFLEKLGELGSTNDPRLPDERTLKVLVGNSWGESLETLVENYWHETCPSEVDDYIWPFPENQCPTINNMENK